MFINLKTNVKNMYIISCNEYILNEMYLTKKETRNNVHHFKTKKKKHIQRNIFKISFKKIQIH